MAMQLKNTGDPAQLSSRTSVFDIFSHVLPTCFATYSTYLSRDAISPGTLFSTYETMNTHFTISP
jgi:hypothetical protein